MAHFQFLSTLSLRRATCRIFSPLMTIPKFLSTLSLRRATDIQAALDALTKISIHALLAESDSRTENEGPSFCISIHALLAESDQGVFNLFSNPGSTFLSTLSLRRATAHHFPALHDILISIHALLAESDVVHALELADPVLFLSTLSLRRATPRGGFCYLDNIISIHALLAESDGRVKSL